MKAVLDASALLSYLGDEPGADLVEDVLERDEAAIGMINWAEVLEVLAGRGEEPADVGPKLAVRGVDKRLSILVVDEGYAVAIARLHFLKGRRWGPRKKRLSFADRSALALGQLLSLPLLTSDGPQALAAEEVGVKVHLIASSEA